MKTNIKLKNKLININIYNKTDNIFNSAAIGKCVSLLIKKGNKEASYNYFTNNLVELKLSFGINTYLLTTYYLYSHRTLLEVRSFRKSNNWYNIPYPVSGSRQYTSGMHLLLKKKDSYKSILYIAFQDFLIKPSNILKIWQLENLDLIIESRAYQDYRWH